MYIDTYVLRFSCPAGKTSYEQYQEFGDPEYRDFRAEAQQHADLRHEAFQKAAKAWKSKQKDLASYYAQQVRAREGGMVWLVGREWVGVNLFV